MHWHLTVHADTEVIWHISVQGINKMNSDAFHFMECGSKFHPQRPEFVNTLVDQSRAKTVKCPTSWSSFHHGGSLHSYLFIAYKQQPVGIRIRVGRGGGVLLINTSDSPRCPGEVCTTEHTCCGMNLCPSAHASLTRDQLG